MPRRRISSAFTLIELLVVIAIISLLAAILFPVFARARESARRSSCLSNLKQIGLSMAMYIQDNDERFTPAWTSGHSFTLPDGGTSNDAMRWYMKLFPYMKNTQVVNCPSSTIDWRGSYSWGGLAYGLNFLKPSWSCCGIPAGADVGVDIAWPGDAGATLGSVEDATGTVLVVDSAYDVLQLTSVTAFTDAEMLGNSNTSVWPTDPMRNIRARHLETVNTLFVDGHAKAMNWKTLVATPGRSYKYWTTSSD